MNHGIDRQADAQARAGALDVEHSFIVQAPAGSGKTELLTQRFLKLLAKVDRPERLLAITFTRKATQEMRHRILHRLRQAESGEPPESEHERLSIVLAQQALQQDQARGWKLLQNPGRLRVLTIDGLCAQFLARDPKLGGLGAGLAVQEISEPLYREAIENLFEELASVADSGEDWSQARQALSRVLYLLDGDAQQLRQLLVNKLRARDQWVDRIGMDAADLQGVIHERQQHELQRFEQALGQTPCALTSRLMAELGALCDPASPPARFAEQFSLANEFGSGTTIEEQVVQAWLFSSILLTGTGALRKPSGLTRSVFKGLPKGPELEAKLLEIRAAFEGWANHEPAAGAIMRMAKAPPLELGSGTAALQQDITLVLAHALARLRVLFHERGECDFHYMTELALQSLGEEDSPGSLLLAEDARIEHILMDEFQDTSNTQFKLLRRLTSGWTGQSGLAGDGRSLFLVGDPMQSIYRFRQANVGLFIDVVQKRKLGNVPLQGLKLQSNFRSREEIVGWINQQFAGIFPPQDERDSGAVRYAPAEAAQGSGGSVALHAFPPKTPYEAEAQSVVQLVQQARAEFGDPTIGILARARKHLEHIARALQQAGIPAQAVKIDELQERPVVRDLIALTRALSHPGDRIAWLAILRAPWAGLSVTELHHIVGDRTSKDILSCLQSAVDRNENGELAERLYRIAQVMSLAESRRGEDSLRKRVETAWLGLGGPWCYASAVELDHARIFLDLLDQLERESVENLETRLSRSLQELYAASPTSRLQLMTIHQAKGLEFDVVIVPGMARKPRADERVLVAMQEFRSESGIDSSLLAPLPPRVKPEASLYAYLRAVEVERSAFEQQRLLYVACTRARTQLHLLGMYSESRNEGVYAPKGSLMEMLFPAFVGASLARDNSPNNLSAATLPPTTVRASLARDNSTNNLSAATLPPTTVGASLARDNSPNNLSAATLPPTTVGASFARDNSTNNLSAATLPPTTVGASLARDNPSDDDDFDEGNEYNPPEAYPLLQLQGAPLLPLSLVGGRSRAATLPPATVGASLARDNPPHNLSAAMLPSTVVETTSARDPSHEPFTLPELPTRKSVAFGEAVHEWLELVHDHWNQGWDAEWFEQHGEALESSLKRSGLSDTEAKEQLPELKRILILAITSEPGKSIVSPEGKQQSWSELPFVRRDGNHISRHIIDRLFGQDRGLTIVDYKTGEHGDAAKEWWIEQLRRYRVLGTGLETSPVTGTFILQTNDNQLFDLSGGTAEAD